MNETLAKRNLISTNSQQGEFDSVLLAEYILALGYSTKKSFNVTQVQKLLYVSYGFALSIANRIISKEKPQAWPYGPVFPRTRKKADYTNIDELESEKFSILDKPLKDLLKQVVATYGVHSASTLSNWSHLPGTPWAKARNKENFNWGDEISDIDIKQYFSSFK